MTLGDVLAALAAVLIVYITWSATLLLVALAFPSRVGQAESQLLQAPGRCGILGVVILLVFGILAARLMGSGAGPVKLLGGVILGGICFGAALGSASIVKILAGRMDVVGSSLTPFGRLTRATALYAMAGFCRSWDGLLCCQPLCCFPWGLRRWRYVLNRRHRPPSPILRPVSLWNHRDENDSSASAGPQRGGICFEPAVRLRDI